MRVQCPFHVTLNVHGLAPIGDRQVLEQVLEQARDGAHSSVSQYDLSGSTARCHANHNKSGKLRESSQGYITRACVRHRTRFIFLHSLRTQYLFYLVIRTAFR